VSEAEPESPASTPAEDDPVVTLGRLVGELGALADRTCDRVEQELRNAHAVGSMTVRLGTHEAKRRLADLLASPQGGSEPSAEPSAQPAKSTKQRTAPEDAAAIDAVIPGYDDLSASQVISLLAELDHEGLGAVSSHEEAHRARRTILNRATQLLGPSAAPA
jgi:hypothetical protein